MKKFILLTFGFLAWAFYEMSGGSGFEPASVRMARLNPTDLAEPDVTNPIVVAEAAPLVPETARTPVETKIANVSEPFVDTDPPLDDLDDTVTRVALNLTSLQEALTDTDATEPTGETSTANDFGVPVNAGSLLASADTPAIIPSLIAPNESSVTTYASSPSDIRTVTANRVNVRGGPGTDFGVVTKLVRGDAVEILQDNGDGWVKMRTLDGGPEGWMADFLLIGG